MLHNFKEEIGSYPLPKRFTFPFNYRPHILAQKAAQQVRGLINQQKWSRSKGKMFGVLVVKDKQGNLGFLAAYSGNIQIDLNNYFVPPIYDIFKPEDYFRNEESQISLINDKIDALLKSDLYLKLQEDLSRAKISSEIEIERSLLELRQKKIIRQKKRTETNCDHAQLVKESQYEKAEHKRLEKRLKEKIEQLEALFRGYNQEIENLKRERKQRSLELQRWIFDKFLIINSQKKYKKVSDLFLDTPNSLPPAGAGDCAAPKLLQYAFLNELQPVTMAEFWWGESPKTELRIDGHYYPACTGKCKPILNFMLEGVELDPDPLTEEKDLDIEIIYQDSEIIVLNKPSGLLSVPGKSTQKSVLDILNQKYPDSDTPLMVHRLDMDTSGILVVARNKSTHKFLQNEFYNHRVIKKYIAVIDLGAKNIQTEEKYTQERHLEHFKEHSKGRHPKGYYKVHSIEQGARGLIDLPLCPDPLDRPRQIVSYEYGKESLTEYEVLDLNETRALVKFSPLTGRTHQLRVHSAHIEGLNSPIVGDNLYGSPDSRLHLHAENITFRHPKTKENITFCSPHPFNI